MKRRFPGERAVSAAVGCVAVAMGLLLPAPAAQAAFGFLPAAEGFDVTALNEGGAPVLQAGSHPWELTTTVNFKLQEGAPEPGGPFTDGDLRDLHIALPPGLIENPAAIEPCALARFNTPRVSPFEASQSGESCPDKSQIGVVAVHTSLGGGTAWHSFGVFAPITAVEPPRPRTCWRPPRAWPHRQARSREPADPARRPGRTARSRSA